MIEFTPTELTAFREEVFKGFSDTQFELSIAECQRRSLIPGTHVLFQLRSSKEWVPELRAKIDVKKIVKITTIEALRLVAQRTGEYEGQGDGEFIYLDADNQPTIVSDIPLPHGTQKNVPREPWAARIPIFRKGFRQPTKVVARMDAYAVTRKNQDGDLVLTDMWLRRGPEMLLKCSTAAALRASFAEELGGLYLAEEFDKEDADTAPAVAPSPTVEPPKPAHVPEVNHAPAVPTDTPRPNDTVYPPLSAPVEAVLQKAASAQTIEDVVLPKKGNPRKAQVAKATETYMADQGRPIPPHEQPVEPYKRINATDADLPAEMFEGSPEQGVSAIVETAPSTETVQKMDTPELTGDEIKAKVRSYDVHGVTREQMKNFSLKVSGKKEPKEITKPEWGEIFQQLDSAFASGGKQAVVDLVKA